MTKENNNFCTLDSGPEKCSAHVSQASPCVRSLLLDFLWTDFGARIEMTVGITKEQLDENWCRLTCCSTNDPGDTIDIQTGIILSSLITVWSRPRQHRNTTAHKRALSKQTRTSLSVMPQLSLVHAYNCELRQRFAFYKSFHFWPTTS